MPNADKFALHSYAAHVELQRQLISARTKTGLAAAEQLRPLLTAPQAQGASFREISQALAGAGCTAGNGKPLSASTVALPLQRLGIQAAEVSA